MRHFPSSALPHPFFCWSASAAKTALVLFELVMVLLLVGCNRLSPTEPLALTGIVWGNVYSASGDCLLGSVVEVLDGPRAGTRSTQVQCNGPSDTEGGYRIRNLPPDISVRLRASKAGYESQVMTVVPRSDPGQSNFILSATVPGAVPATNDLAIWVRSGACLEGAVVELLDGAYAGTRKTQSNCEPIWEGGGVLFTLPSGLSVRVRASKEGYQSQEMTTVPGRAEVFYLRPL